MTRFVALLRVLAVVAWMAAILLLSEGEASADCSESLQSGAASATDPCGGQSNVVGAAVVFGGAAAATAAAVGAQVFKGLKGDEARADVRTLQDDLNQAAGQGDASGEGESSGQGSGTGDAEARTKKIQDELVEKLNRRDDAAGKLLGKYWEQADGNDRIIRRKRVDVRYEGVELPVLRRKAGGDYEIHHPSDASNDVPAEPKKGARWVGGRDSAPPELLEDADILAAGRPHIWSYLDEANHAVKGDFKPDSDFSPPLDKFDQAGFNDVQSNHWNNKLGELAADHAVLDGLRQPEFVARPLRRVDVPDRGAHHFDRVYQDADGNYVIVEAKGPSADLKGNGGYQQGHPEYVRNIRAKMIERGEPEATHAHEILKQLESEQLRYFSVRAQVEKTDLSRYTDEQLRAMPAAARPADRYAGYVVKEYDLTITTKKPAAPPAADGP